jgi:hypothetical protein
MTQKPASLRFTLKALMTQVIAFPQRPPRLFDAKRREPKMIGAKEAVVWVNHEVGEVMVRPHSWGIPEDHGGGRGRGHWGDPIGAAYA